MISQTQQVEMVLLNAIAKDELARIVAELVRDNKEVQKALINLMCNSPNVMTEI